MARTHTEEIEQVLREVLQGEDAGKLLTGLSEGDLNLLYELMGTLRGEGSGISDELWLVDYMRKPPTMMEFITDGYWLGSVLVPNEYSKGLFPTWRDRLVQDFDLDSRVHNIVITGSLAIGKTYVTSVIFLYRVVLASLLRYPERFFGLGKGSRIYYVLLSITRAAVNDTIFGDVQNFMANSPFFKEECGYDPDRKYADLRVNLGKGIFITAGSKGWHVIGRNTMGVALDEGNWRIESNPDQRAYELYGEVRQRIKGRFQQITGHLPAISILASSARDESAFTEQVITEIQTNNNRATELVYRYASYEIKAHELRPGQRWFRVAYGLKNIEPAILLGYYSKDGAQESGPFEEPPHGSQVKLVPEVFLPEFKRNLKSSLQAICGVSTGGSHLFFSNTIELELAVTMGEKRGMKPPADVEYIPISVEDSLEVWDYLKHDRFVTKRSGSVIPLRDPDAPRFAHLDMATESVAGISICHAVGRTEVKGIFNPDIPFQLFNEYRVVAEFDFMLAIVAGKSRPISFEKVMRFFFWLREKCGYRFECISADQFQSVLPLEIFETRGFKTKNVSVDRTKLPYYSFRSAFMERRIWMYRHNLFMREAEHLIDGPEKVDHPPASGGGSKDITDSACGAYFDLINSDVALSVGSSSLPALMGPDASDEEQPPVDVMPPDAPKRNAPIPVFSV